VWRSEAPHIKDARDLRKDAYKTYLSWGKNNNGIAKGIVAKGNRRQPGQFEGSSLRVKKINVKKVRKSQMLSTCRKRKITAYEEVKGERWGWIWFAMGKQGE